MTISLISILLKALTRFKQLTELREAVSSLQQTASAASIPESRVLFFFFAQLF
jgi:hypothetical protein